MTTIGIFSRAAFTVATLAFTMPVARASVVSPTIDAPTGGETIRRISPPGNAAGHAGAGSVSAFGATATLAFAPAPYASASSTNADYYGRATGTYNFGVSSTDPLAGEIPIIVHYTLRLVRPDLTPDLISLAQISVHSVNLLSGVDRSATFATDCTYCEVIGVGSMNVLANDYTNYVTLFAAARGVGVTAFADPFIEVDPTYALIDPDYLIHTRILQSDSVANAQALDVPATTDVPEPGSMALLLGMIGVGAALRQRRAA